MNPASCTVHRESCIVNRESCIVNRASCIVHRASVHQGGGFGLLLAHTAALTHIWHSRTPASLRWLRGAVYSTSTPFSKLPSPAFCPFSRGSVERR